MCFDNRRIPVKIIMFMSGISAAAGIVMIIFAFLFTKSDVIEQMEK